MLSAPLLLVFAPSAFVQLAVTRTGGTLSLADSNGASGEQCITFRNNVQVKLSKPPVLPPLDRQMTPGISAAGLPVLFVERSFGAAQAAPLMGADPCIGFNGTDFLAQDCSKLSAATADTLSTAGELVAGTTCSTGVDNLSQLTTRDARRTQAPPFSAVSMMCVRLHTQMEAM